MRKSIVFAAALSLFVSATASQAATVIGFEDLQDYDSFGPSGWNNWNTYQGYVWGYGTSGGVANRNFNGADTGWASATETNSPGGPPPANVSGTAYAWTYNGPQSLWVDFQTSVDVTSVDLAALTSTTPYIYNSSTVQLFGYDAADNLIGFTGPFVLTTSLQTFAANLIGVQYLELRSDRNFSWFSLDNLTLNGSAVPEPGTWAMMLLGFGAIGFALRRSKRQPRIQLV